MAGCPDCPSPGLMLVGHADGSVDYVDDDLDVILTDFLSAAPVDLAVDESGGLHAILANDSYLRLPTGSGIPLGLPGPVAGLAVSNGLAYVRLATEELLVLDVSNPFAPVSLGSVATPGYGASGGGIAAHDGAAYLCGSGFSASPIQVVDAGDPAVPVLGDVLDVAVREVRVQGGRLHGIGSQTVIHDLADPVVPAEIARVKPGGEVLSLTGDRMVLGGAFGHGTGLLSVLDVSTPSPLDPVDEKLVSGGSIHGWGGTVAVLTQGTVHLFDVATDPASPVEVGSLPVPGGDRVRLIGDVALVATGSTLVLLDVSDPSAPAVSATVPVAARHAFADGDRGYVLTAGTLEVLDLGDPAAPVVLGSVPAPDGRDLVVDGDVVNVLADGLRTFDVSDPSAPSPLGVLPASGGRYFVGAALDGDVLYVNDTVDIDFGFSPTRLRRIDVSDPSNPVEIDAPISPVSVRGQLTVRDGFLYVGPAVVDISGDDPVRVGQAVNGGPSMVDVDSWVGATHLYVVDGLADTFRTYPLHCGTSVAVAVPPVARPLLHLRGPNPTRASTRFEVTLDGPGRVTLDLFDVSGRRVSRLVDGPRSPGRLAITWSGRDHAGRLLPAGRYFARLHVDGEPQGTVTLTRLP